MNQSSFPSIHWIVLQLLFSKIVSSRVGMLHNVNNFGGLMQKNHRIIHSLLGDSMTDESTQTSLKLILCTIKLMSQHFPHYPQTILSLFY